MRATFKNPRQITVQLKMKLLIVFLCVIVACFAEELAEESKKNVKRGILGFPGYASGYGYSLHGHHAPVVASYPVVSKISYGYRPYSGYYGSHYGYGHGHGLYGYGHGWGGYGLGHGYGYYPWHGYYGLGHGYYGLGHGYYGYGDWW